MTSRLPVCIKRIEPRKAGLAALLALGLGLAAGPELWAQTQAPPAGAAPNSEMKFEVLDVTTGSGSKTQGPENSELKIEVIDATQGGSGSTSGTASPAGKGQVVPPPAKPVAANAPPEEKRAALIAALELWHYQTLATYNYNVMALADPFLPIKEVRGVPPVKPEQDDDPRLPAILRMELNQIKLVAIVTVQNGPARASFEDGAGNSYILRQGDRIARRGRIIKITPSTVTVEEQGRRAGDPSEITDIRLNVTSTDGVVINDMSNTSAQ